MARSPHGHAAAKTRNRSPAFAQFEAHRHGAIEVFKASEDQRAVVLQGLNPHLAGLPLQGLDRQGVIEAGGQVVAQGGGAEVKAQLQIQFKPLA